MGVYDALFDDGPMEPTEAVDAGPAARRAASGMPPEAGTVDPNPGEITMQPGQTRFDVFREQAGRAIGNSRPFLSPVTGERVTGGATGDPDAAGIVATGVTGPLAARAAPMVGRAIGPALAPPAVGAAAGAGTAKMIGADAAPGAAIGAAFPALRVVLGGVGAAEARALAGRGDSRLYSELGRGGTEKMQAKLERLGQERVTAVAREIGLPTAPDKRVPIANELRSTGAAIGDVYAAVDAAGHGRTLGDVMTSMDGLHGRLNDRFGKEAGDKLYQAVHDRMASIWDAYGAKKEAVIPLGEINKIVTGLEATGFGNAGAQLSQKTQSVLAREMARTLNGELDAGLGAAASNPNLAPAVNRLHDLNSRYRTLKALEPIAARVELRRQFAKPAADRDANFYRDVKALGRRAVSSIPQAGDAIARAVGGPRMGGEVKPLSPVAAKAINERDDKTLRSWVAGELFAQ